MSYDFSMVIDAGNGDINVGVFDTDFDDCDNYTFNVSPIFKKALKTENGITDLEKITGKESIPILRVAIQDIEDHMPGYRLLNPDNGWGNVEGALKVLRMLLRWCLKAPLARIKVS